MADNLVIVESPAKAKTIQKYLGDDFTVKSSFGHIRDLQDNKLSVDVEKGFAPEYVIPADKRRVVADLKRAADSVSTVWLASDEDREGEAISWHLFETLGLKEDKTKRIVFHEITKDAILNAVRTPRSIDMNLVNAQQARRVLDRLVGFELSPVLWRKIQPKLSAGRVQSVALRLVVEREKEIMNFLAYLKEGNQSILQERPKEDPDRNKMYQAFEFYANGGFPILCKKLGVDFADKSKNDRYTILHNYYNMLVSNDLMDV